MNIKCLVIDDEPLARKGLKEYIADVDFLELIGEFENALKATDRLKGGDVQLLFLDVQMPKITGIEFFKSLQHPPPVIFTTAYPQFALEGFEVNALDYLVKPISFERFLKAAMKAREYYEVREKNSQEHEGPSTNAAYFFVKSDNKLVKILFEDMLFAEALQNYVVIHTKDRKYITYLTFKSVEDYLPNDRFIRTHKSYIVAVSRIDSIEGNDLRVGQHQIPISRGLKEEVMAKLLNNRYLRR
jgi:DNA-binding LytR/AlgR family response regulator